MQKPRVLVTNDDGVGCFFLQVLVEALKEHFTVVAVAPKSEQSWVSKSMSRYRTVRVEKFEGLNCPAWSVDGTPSDCVNIALGNLLDEKPDVVVSGINVGYNTSIPLIMCSGTIAGASEGALWGIPAFAFSIVVPKEIFNSVKSQNGHVDKEFETSLRTAASISTQLTIEHINKTQKGLIVHNVNFPYPVDNGTPIEHTVPDDRGIGGLFKQISEDTYQFSYDQSKRLNNSGKLTDRDCVNQGSISYTPLNYSNIGA
jgi:5'-nucleotidase